MARRGDFLASTGVVRRIDDLGRIVIPKEIRKTLRIKEGESLEISVNNDEIVLKKFSFLGKIHMIAEDLVTSIYSTIKKNIFITDLDSIIAFAGDSKKEYKEKKLCDTFTSSLLDRKELFEQNLVRTCFVQDRFENCYYYLRPIIIHGDLVGSIVIWSKEVPISDLDLSIITIMNHFLEKYLEV